MAYKITRCTPEFKWRIVPLAQSGRAARLLSNECRPGPLGGSADGRTPACDRVVVGAKFAALVKRVAGVYVSQA